jgi:hypothetical protein
MEQTEDNGQIHLRTEFGYHLLKLAADQQYKTYLEVGTWMGNGTTRCLVQGVLERDTEDGEEVHLYSIEANLTFYLQAFQRWLPWGYPFLHLCYGKLHEQGLLTAQEIENHDYYGWVVTHYEMWYAQDCKDYEAAPYLQRKHFPKEIDVVVLDGGEFSGYADWLAVKKMNPKVVCLDDTVVMKNERVYKELLKDEAWELLAENPEDRHGWAIFSRKG